MKRFIVLAAFFTPFAFGALDIPDDMKEMAQMLHDNCIDESGVDAGLIGPCAQGVFPDDGKLKCYFKCIFTQMGALSEEGELDADAFSSILPEGLAGPLTKMISACKDTKGSDPCDTAYKFNQCLYKADPPNFLVI